MGGVPDRGLPEGGVPDGGVPKGLVRFPKSPMPSGGVPEGCGRVWLPRFMPLGGVPAGADAASAGWVTACCWTERASEIPADCDRLVPASDVQPATNIPAARMTMDTTNSNPLFFICCSPDKSRYVMKLRLYQTFSNSLVTLCYLRLTFIMGLARRSCDRTLVRIIMNNVLSWDRDPTDTYALHYQKVGLETQVVIYLRLNVKHILHAVLIPRKAGLSGGIKKGTIATDENNRPGCFLPRRDTAASRRFQRKITPYL